MPTWTIGGPYYPAVFVAPNGKVFLAGFPQTSRYLDVTGAGTWTTVGNRKVANRMKGSAVMYAPGKILYVGGGDPPTKSAEVIDLNQASPSWRTVPGMAFARRQLNATILADGQVLVTHGTSGPAGSTTWPRRFAWPSCGTRRPSPGPPWPRSPSFATYHSTALLLPDARVLSSGSGEGGGVNCANSEFSAQVFSPPYLFKPTARLASGRVITSAPSRSGLRAIVHG